ncbi:MAG: DnaA regulatory inactivator Hda [Proteobacteria bacterium]|nr:DnaA regulatory inactivator Hda [Pseudomonadota bacterium]MDA0992908.1 DnaA regulatory inactivator Hda [Pseudomonadota bacterium]
MSQLVLPLKLQDHAVFESFLPIGNEALVAFLERTVATANSPGGWIRGAHATGKTHLLQAVCERAGDQAQFLPLADFVTADPTILEGMAIRQFICIDDVDAVSGDSDWELALFSLYNSLIESGGVLICSAASAPRDCGFGLADLTSRFSRLPTFNLHSLEESQRIEALQLRARHRGLEMPTETAGFLLNRSPRDMASLYAMLDKLDAEAMIAKRKLTIPFVKEVLEIT